MKDYQNPFANGAYNYNHILSFSRSLDRRGRHAAWSGETLYWHGIQGSWSNLQLLSRELSSPWNGPVATAGELTAVVDPFQDDDTGETIPVLVNSGFAS